MSKILNFHKVDSAVWFNTVISLLKSKYEFVPVGYLDAFYNTGVHTKKFCHITVDDGDISFYNNIYPVLKKHKISATLFVSPKACNDETNFWFQEIVGYDDATLKKIVADTCDLSAHTLNRYDITCILKCLHSEQVQEVLRIYRQKTNTALKPFQNMTVEQLLEVKASGLVTIGAHTMNHPILQNEDDNTSRYELEQSIQGLQQIMNGNSVEYFAYPNGISGMDFGAREEKMLKDAGIRLGFSTDYRNFSLTDNPMRVPRIGVSSDENIYFLQAKLLLGSSWDKLAKAKTNSEYQQRKQLRALFKDHVFA